MSTVETAEQIFNEGIEANKTRDAIIVEMVMAGVSLNSAQNFYKDMAKEAGITKGKLGFKTEALDFIALQDVDLTDREARLTLKLELASKYDVTPNTAHDYIRAYAADAGIDLGTSTQGSADSETIYQYIVANPHMDKPAFRDFMEDLGRSKGNIDETWRGIVLAKRILTEGVWDNVSFVVETPEQDAA